MMMMMMVRRIILYATVIRNKTTVCIRIIITAEI